MGVGIGEIEDRENCLFFCGNQGKGPGFMFRWIGEELREHMGSFWTILKVNSVDARVWRP